MTNVFCYCPLVGILFEVLIIDSASMSAMIGMRQWIITILPLYLH